MGKKHRYKDTKGDDKFHAALAAAWARIEPYALKIGIGLGAVLVIAAVWIFVGKYLAARSDRPWEKRFAIHQETLPPRAPDPEAAQDEASGKQAEFDKAWLERREKRANELAALAADYAGKPVAAVTLLELSSLGFAIGKAKRAADPAGAMSFYQRAAEAGEQFLTAFPDHSLAAVAANNAGKARLELADLQREVAPKTAQANFDWAARHFQKAIERCQAGPGPGFPHLVAFAKFHAALCYESIQRRDEARRLFQEVRKDTMAGWLAQQAEYHLIQLERQFDPGG